MNWHRDSRPRPSTTTGSPQPNTPSHMTMEEVEGWIAKFREEIDWILGRLKRSTGVGDHDHNDPYSFAWFIPDDLTTGDQQGGILCLDRDVTVLTPVMNVYAGEEPGTQAIIVDMDYSTDNCVSWSALFSTRPQIAAGARVGGSGAVAAVASLTSGTFIRVNIDQVGAGSDPGGNLTIQFRGTQA
jgi:hypothetical protein